MKAKITYYCRVEKEIDIPDRLVELTEKGWDATIEEDKEREDIIDAIVDKVSTGVRNFQLSGIYYGEDFTNAITEV